MLNRSNDKEKVYIRTHAIREISFYIVKNKLKVRSSSVNNPSVFRSSRSNSHISVLQCLHLVCTLGFSISL